MKTLLAISLGTMWSVAIVAAQAPSESAADPAREAVTILRAVNTAQAELNATVGGYGSVSKVLGSARFKKMFVAETTTTDSATATVGKSTLILVVSEDQKHYQAVITPADKCGVTMFTNEGGMIYKGHALGCDTGK